MFGIGRKERSARVEQLLDRVDLAPDGDRPVGEYSQGMRKRIALAQSLINDPELLLLDEPTASLDPASAERVQEIVREKARAGRTVVLSSHLLGRVEEVATRVCIVYRGREARTGTLEEVAGIPGALDVRVRGASPEDLGRLFEGAGIEMESCGPASRPLREVFLRLTSPGDEETTPSGAEDGGREEEEGP